MNLLIGDRMLFKNIKFKTPIRLLFLFEIMTLILLASYDYESITDFTIKTIITLIAIVYFSNRLLSKVSKGDRYVFLIVSMLISIGVIMIYRINSNLGEKQLIWIILGVLSFFITYFIMKSYKHWDRFLSLYVGGIYFLFLLTFTLGTVTKGAKNWIEIGGISFQPAEFIKILLIFVLASYYSKQDYYKEKTKYSSLILMAIVYSFLGLLFLQKDLGMAVVFYGIFVSIQFVYEEDRKLLLYNIILFVVGAVIAYFLFDHVKIRFQAWIDPWKYIEKQGYQITQSLFAIAEGGFFGSGIGLGYPSFIPEVHTDFIFGAICEEMGTLTGIGIIMLFLIFVYRGFKIAMEQKILFYRILALSISISFGIQIFIILGGVLKVIPLTGITLPFISYGGSSMLTSYIALGALQRSSENIEEDKYAERG